MSSAPPPLTPADADLQDFPCMMINIVRLRGSAFDAMIDSEAWRAGVNLWMAAFHQVPAGSLADSEAELVKAAGLGRDLRTWRRVKHDAMHGWVLASDGRWYHETVAETVLEAWIVKLVQRFSSGAGNNRRHGTPFDPDALSSDIRHAADLLYRINPKSEALQKKAVAKARAGLPMDVPSGDPSGSLGKGREGKKTPKPPEGASIELKKWGGSPDILQALAAEKGPAWALTWLARCREQEVPFRALITSNGVAHDALKREASGALRALGVRVVLEAAA